MNDEASEGRVAAFLCAPFAVPLESVFDGRLRGVAWGGGDLDSGWCGSVRVAAGSFRGSFRFARSAERR